jgi:hypothetical protein
MKEKINDIEKVKELKNKFEILIRIEEEINDDDNLKNYIKKYEFDEIKTIINNSIEKEISRLNEKKENEKEKEENQKLINLFIQQKDIYSNLIFNEKELKEIETKINLLKEIEEKEKNMENENNNENNDENKKQLFDLKKAIFLNEKNNETIKEELNKIN